MNFDFETSFIILGKFIFFAKTGFCTFCHFWTGLSLVILINLGFRQKPKFFKISVGFVKFAKWYQNSKKEKKTKVARYPKKSKKSRFAGITELAKLSFLSVERLFSVISEFVLVVLIETLLYCIFCMYVNCVLTEHLAECERFRYFSKYKVVKSKIKSVPSSFFWLPFLYLPNVFIHEPNEFIHVRVVNKLSKFKFTIQRLSELVLTSSVGKGDCQIVPPSGGNLLSVTLWCLHLGHCYSSTHLLYNFVHYIQNNQFDTEHFFARAKGVLEGT